MQWLISCLHHTWCMWSVLTSMHASPVCIAEWSSQSWSDVFFTYKTQQFSAGYCVCIESENIITFYGNPSTYVLTHCGIVTLYELVNLAYLGQHYIGLWCSARSRSEPVPVVPSGLNWSEIYQSIQNVSLKKCIWKYHLQNVSHLFHDSMYYLISINGFMQNYGIFSASAMEILQSCTKLT